MKYEFIKWGEEDKKFLVKAFKIYGWVWFVMGMILGFIVGGIFK